MVLKVRNQNPSSPIIPSFLQEKQPDLFLPNGALPSYTNIGYFFASLIHALVGGELENLQRPGFTPEMKELSFCPDIYIPHKEFEAARQFVECKFSSRSNSVDIRASQMIAYLKGHQRELQRTNGHQPETYFAIGRYNDFGKVGEVDFSKVLEHISQGINGAIIMPQYALLHHAITRDNALVSKRYEAGIQKAKLTKLLRGDEDTINGQVEDLREILTQEGYHLDDKLFRTTQIQPVEFGERTIRYKDNEFKTNPFTIYVVQDTSPILFNNFLGQNLCGLEGLILEGQGVEISQRMGELSRKDETEIRRLYGIPEGAEFEDYIGLIEDIGGRGSSHYLN